jgi:hypothetical protein
MRFKNNLALPIISNQKMNEAIKEMGYKAGIKSPQRIGFTNLAQYLQKRGY